MTEDRMYYGATFSTFVANSQAATSCHS